MTARAISSTAAPAAVPGYRPGSNRKWGGWKVSSPVTTMSTIPSVFTDVAIQRIAAYTGGTPRLINILCDHCLLMGYAEQTRRIDGDMVRRGIDYLEEGGRPSRREDVRWARATASLRWVLGGLGAAAVGGLAVFALGAKQQVEGALGTVMDHVLYIARGARDLVMR